MRTVIVISAGVAALGLLVGSIASSAVVTGIAAGARGAHADTIPWRSRLRDRMPPSPTPCSSGFPTNSFNAIRDVADHAGGDDSAILAGTGNDACAQSTSVSGGDYNVVGRGAADSFIGGGYFNYVSADQSGVTAGDGNNVSAENAGVGAGYSNYVYGSGTNSFIAAGDNNNVNAYGAFIGAGQGNNASGDSSVVVAGDDNNSLGGDSIVGAGLDNNALAPGSLVGAGYLNAVSAPGYGSFIGAGGSLLDQTDLQLGKQTTGNQIAGWDSFIGAGDQNRITGNGSIVGAGGYVALTKKELIPNDQIAGNDSFIGAGDGNSVSANEAFIGSGQGNSIAAAATYSAIAGGSSNTAGNADAAVGGGRSNNATGAAAVVGGGADNTAQGTYATIPGGYLNAADGIGSFAAGTLAKARTNGAFVWSDDSTTAELQSTVNDQFLARASGGFFLFSNSAATLGVKLSPNSGTWASASDRNLKSDVVPLDDAAVLAKVAALPITEWSYRSEAGVRHVGPMAQDFYAAFRVGEDDRHITSIDEDGVALAAIKALHADNASLHSENVALRDRLAALERKVAALAISRSSGFARR
jgi:hypothetical protein